MASGPPEKKNYWQTRINFTRYDDCLIADAYSINLCSYGLGEVRDFVVMIIKIF